jgi:hypothetical protein
MLAELRTCRSTSLRRLRLGVAGEMDFHALRQQTFAAPLTPPGEGGAPGFRAHARAKTVLLFPGAFRALECPFHNVGRRRAATLRATSLLSIAPVVIVIVIVLVLLLVIDSVSITITITSTSTRGK